MTNASTTITEPIIELIEKTVRESMAPFGLREVRAIAGEDHDGEPVIFVEAEYELSETPIDTAVTARLISILRDRLWERGERRFPHIRHKFDERQKIGRLGRVRA